MKELQKKLIEMLKGYSFKEMEDILNRTELPEARGAILEAMEKYHKVEFNKWLESLGE